MQLRRYLLLLWATLWLAQVGHAASGRPDTDAEAQLLSQIHMAESLYRDDIVSDALSRLYRISPRHPEGMAAQLRQALRREDLDQARELLEQLCEAAPDSTACQMGRALMALNTPEAARQLAQGRLLAAGGRFKEALEVYDALFHGVYPTADLALEYWQVRAAIPGGRVVAIPELSKALQSSPAHAGILRALANYLFLEKQPDQARRYLHKLGELKEHRSWAANREYDYLATLPVGQHSRQQWLDFVARYGSDAAGDKGRAELDRQNALLGDADWQSGQEGLRLLNSGKSALAIARLKKAVAAYPDDIQLIGALGLAYLRTGDRQRALHYFESARDKELREDRTSKWVSLIESTQHWLLLQRAAQAGQRNDWAGAHRLYLQANKQDPADVFALVGLGDAALNMGRRDAAWGHFRRALQVAPDDAAAQRGILRYVEGLPADEAIEVLDRLPARSTPILLEARRGFQVRRLTEQAEKAQQEKQWAAASAALAQAQSLLPDDPWLSYQLALALRNQGLEQEAMQAFQRHLTGNHGVPASHYAHGLLLADVDQWEAVLGTLNQVDPGKWSKEMTALESRVKDRQTMDRARLAYDAGRVDEAMAVLKQRPDSNAVRLLMAEWSYKEGRHSQALALYAAVLQDDPQNPEAQLGQLEIWAAQGRQQAASKALAQREAGFEGSPTYIKLRAADLWVSLGEPGRARQMLRELENRRTGPEPQLLRDLARLTAADDARQALDYYALSMRDLNLLPAEAVQPVRDDVEFTRATREQGSDGWLQRSVRREAEHLYQRNNPTLTVHNDNWWRHGGTSGLSQLNANTTIAHLDYPMMHGKGFLRADHVRMDAGSLDAEPGTRFGSCVFSARDAGGRWQSLPGCPAGQNQRAQGTGVALGWQGDHLAFDLGTSPQGFTVKNWLGGASYANKLGSVGWRLTGSRRPMSNSLLSFAGTTDPRTGIEWGGVVATGAALGLSWDKGEENGVWADISHHRLTGKNVADNHRTRVMGGYYRRLINRGNEQLTIGLNAMYWSYQKNLGDYTLGQGGYYSPQRYTSLSLPIAYAYRSENWSVAVEGAVAYSNASSDSSAYYPLAGLVAGPMRQLQGRGVGAGAFEAANTLGGSRRSGVGYSLRGAAEYRLDNHWVVGGSVDVQHSKDYAPSRFILYLRYSFEPWQGNLLLRPAALTPYAEFK